MKRFIDDIKKYYKYIIYSIKSELKNEVIGSYLGWLWLILEPLCFMLIYTFISVVVFDRGTRYIAAFVFIGLSMWNFFNKTLVASVKMVTNNKDIVTKVYVPKFVLLLIKMGVNLFKMGISFVLVFISMILYKVPISFNVLWLIPVIIILILFTFGISCLLLHFGVFAEDLSNLTTLVLKFLFYLSGIFYSIPDRIPKPYNNYLLNTNFTAGIINAARDSLLYASHPRFKFMIAWLFISLFLCYFGIKKIYKYENTYVKVMR